MIKLNAPLLIGQLDSLIREIRYGEANWPKEQLI